MMIWPSNEIDQRGYLAAPGAGKGPGVLVLHAWWGLTHFITELCDRLAAEGFVAFAPDLFAGQTAQTIDQAEQLVGTEDYEATKTIIENAVDFLHQHLAVHGDQIGIIGFSYGAAYALLAATHLRPAEIGATVVIYGNHPGLDRDDYAIAESAFLGHFAEDDPYEKPEDARKTLAEMHAAGREATLHFYSGTGHWFFEADRPDAYHPEAAQLVWERTLTFLQRRL